MKWYQEKHDISTSRIASLKQLEFMENYQNFVFIKQSVTAPNLILAHTTGARLLFKRSSSRVGIRDLGHLPGLPPQTISSPN